MTLFNKAIPVLLSDTINIPQPGEYISATSSTGGATITTAGAEFKGQYNPARTGYSNRVAVGPLKPPNLFTIYPSLPSAN